MRFGPRSLDRNPAVRVARFAEGDDCLHERGDGRDEGPAEHKEENAQPHFASIEVVDAEPAQEECEEDVRHFAHQLAAVGRVRDVRPILFHERLWRVCALTRAGLLGIARLSGVGRLRRLAIAGLAGGLRCVSRLRSRGLLPVPRLTFCGLLRIVRLSCIRLLPLLLP